MQRLLVPDPVQLPAPYSCPPDLATLWRVRSHVAVAVKQALDQAGIRIPFPQRVLHFGDDGPAEWARDQVETSRGGD